MKIYENVVIGNFLYILGLFDGACIGPSAPTRRAVSLLQQTPLDKSIADVLVQSPGSIFIIEFKRKGASELKEDGKKDALKIALKDLPELRQLSNEIHWYVRSEVVEKQLKLEVMPYLGTQRDPSVTSLESLVEKIMQRRGSPHDVSASGQYLRALRLASKIAEGKGNAGASSGTIVVLESSEGGFRHVVIDDLADIFKVHNELIAPTTEPEDEAKVSYPDDAFSPGFEDGSESASQSFTQR